MRLLALETSGEVAAAALVAEEGVLAELSVLGARQHAEHLHPAIDAVCRLAGVPLAAVDAVAADVGPGLFTGIRVGVAAAKAVALAAGRSCVPVTSLRVIRAAAVDAGARGTVVPVVDLRRGEVAWSIEDETAWGKPAELVVAVEGRRDVVFAGDGAVRYRAVIEAGSEGVVAGGITSPPVATLARIALHDLDTLGGIAPAELSPAYLREADVRISWTTRHDAPGRAS